jgi:hypothetical protein
MDATATPGLHATRPWRAAAWALPLVVVVPMLALASALGVHAIIVPEGAALVMGVWVLALPGWTASRRDVALLPPLCALFGVMLARSDLSLVAASMAGVALSLAALHAFDSRLAPSLSTAVLPIVFGVSDWSYPLAVLVICLVLAAGMPWLARRRGPPALPRDRAGRYPAAVVGASLAVIVAWLLVEHSLLGLGAAALAPPLFVSALEWLGQGACTLRRGVRRWLLLVGAALVGVLATTLVPSPALAGAIALAATLALMVALRTPHPPALAITIIPQLLHAPNPLHYTIAIAVGAAALYSATLAVARIAVSWRATGAFHADRRRPPSCDASHAAVSDTATRS